MKLIAHRGLWNDPRQANTMSAFTAAFQAGVGLETDIRAFRGKLYLSHDVIKDPTHLPTFGDLIKLALEFPAQPIFLNIKEDGLLEFLSPYQNELKKLRAIFFDMSVPQLVCYAKHFPPSMLAARVSDIEPYPSGIEFCDYLWVDGFFRELTTHEIKALYKYSNKRCAFVSPELHGRNAQGLWNLLKSAPWLPKDRTFLCTDLVPSFYEEVPHD